MKQILQQISPNREERNNFEAATKTFIAKLNSKLKDAKAILGGSGAKDTWLSGIHDVDVFVQFDYKKFSNKSKQLSDLLESALKKSFPKAKLERLHGSRDYFQLDFDGIAFEIVPILKVNKPAEAKNITDLSPLHSIWVNKHTQKLKDEIRLAKQFFKANRLYGAESYIGGFSGYVLEILVAYYSSFEKLLLVSQKWKEKEVIDPEKYYPKKDALFHLNQSKQQSPLIVIDPVDKNRNAAAALYLEKFLELKKIAKEYLKKKEAKFFRKEEVTLENLKKLKQPLVFLEVQTEGGKEDVIGAQLMKAFNFLKEKLAQFGIKKSGWEYDKHMAAKFYFILEKKELPEFEIRFGPPLKMKEFVADFKKSHSYTYEEKGKICAKIQREHPKLSDFVNSLLKEEYFKEKVKKVKILS